MITLNLAATGGTILAAVLVLLLGRFVQKKVTLFNNFFIPAPVIGGFIVSLILSILGHFEIMTVLFDNTLQNMLLITFFTTVGFSASITLLRREGKMVLWFFFCVGLLIILQNIVSLSIAWLLGQSPALGMATGSIPMTGGHGTSAAFAPLLANDLHLDHALSITTAAATFGLIAGSLLGGPVGRLLMSRYQVKPDVDLLEAAHVKADLDEDKPLMISEHGLFDAVVATALAFGIGGFITLIFTHYDIVIPAYIGAMIAAAVIRNIVDLSDRLTINDNGVTLIGNISLGLFLSMALMQMNLIALVDLAIPIFILLSAQVVLVALYAYFVTFRVMGKDYDAVVVAVGHCGFSLGATPNAMANMDTFTARHFPSPQAFFLLAIAASLFVDFFNASVITSFVNFLK